MDEMTRQRRDRAIAVARDVIEQVEGRKSYRIDTGSYILPDYDGDNFAEVDISGDIRERFDEIAPACTVCMLGACMLSVGRVFGGVTYDQRLGHRDQAVKALAGAFDPATLVRIEAAFEGSVGFGTGEASDQYGAAVFGLGFDSPADRAVAIARNIIDHDGDFIVPAATAEEWNAAYYGDDYDDDIDDYDDDIDDDDEIDDYDDDDEIDD